MAKDTYNFDDDSFDDFDHLFDQEPEFKAPKPKSGKRMVVEGAVGSFAGGVKDKFLDEDFQRDLIDRSLPPGYTTVYDGLRTVKSGITGVYDEAKKSMKQVSNEIKKATRSFMPKIRGAAPRGIADRIENWAGRDRNEVHQWRDSEKDRQNASIEAALGDVFGSYMSQQRKVEDERDAQNQLTQLQKDIVDTAYKKDLNKGVDELLRLATKRDSYHDNVGIKVHRKMIELLTRQTMLQIKLNDTLTKMFEMSDTRLNVIQNNTAMPEFVKLHDSERVREIMANKVYGKVSEKMSNRIADTVNSIKNKMTSKITDTASQITSMISLGGEALKGNDDGGEFELSMAESDFEMENGRPMTDDEKNKWIKNHKRKKLGEMIGKQGVDPAAEFLAKRIAAAIQKRTGNNEDVKRIGLAGKNIMNDSGAYLQEAIKRSNDMPVLGALIRAFGIDELRDDGQSSLIKRSGQEFLAQKAFWTNREAKSLNVIIPGWLGKIHNEIKMHRTGVASDPEIFSLERDRFVSKKEHMDRVKAKAFDTGAIENSRKRLQELYDSIDPEGALSPKAQAALKAHLTKAARKGTGTVNLRTMVGKNSPFEDMTVLAELRAFVEQKYGVKSDNSKVDVDELDQVDTRWGRSQGEWDDSVHVLDRRNLQLGRRLKRAGQKIRNNEMFSGMTDDMSLSPEVQAQIEKQRKLLGNLRTSMPRDYEASLNLAMDENLPQLLELGLVREYPPGSGNYHYNFEMMEDMITQGGTPAGTPPSGSPPPGSPPSSRANPPKKRKRASRRSPPPPAADEGDAEITRYHTGGIAGQKPDHPFPTLSVKGIGEQFNQLQRRLMGRGEMLSVLKVGEEVITPDDHRHRVNQKEKDSPMMQMLGMVQSVFDTLKMQHIEKARASEMVMDYLDDISQQLALSNLPQGEEYDGVRAVGAGANMNKRSKWRQRLSSARSAAGTAVKLTGKAIGAPFKLGWWATKLNVKAGVAIGKGVGKVLGAGAGLVGGGLDYLTESKTKIGEKQEDKQLDVFTKGKRKPVLTATGLAGGEYFDAKTGKVLKTLGDIKGEVVDSMGNIMLSQEQFEEGIFVKEKSMMVKLGRGLGAVGKGIFRINMLPFKVLGMMGRGGAAMWRGLTKTMSYVDDIYVEGEQYPRVLASVFNNGGYLTLEGRPARKLKDIIHGLMTADGSVVLSHQDIAKGLVYKNGKEVKIGNVAIRMIRGGVKMIGAGIGAAYKIAMAGIKLPFKIIGGAAKLLSNGLGKFNRGKMEEFKVKTTLYQVDLMEKIFKVLDKRLPNANKGKVRKGSLEDIMSREKKADDKDTIVNVNVDGDGKKRTPWGMLLGMVSGVIGAIKAMKEAAVMWLKRIALGRAAGAVLDGLGGEGGRNDRRRRNGPNPPPGGGPNPPDDNGAGAGRGRFGMLKAAALAGAGYMGMSYAQDAMAGGVDQAADAATQAAEEGGSVISEYGGLAASMAAGVAAEQLITNPAARATAARVATQIGIRAAAIGAGALGLITAPVLIGAAAVAAVAVGGYMLYKYLDARKYPILNFRLAQYGFEPGGKQAEKVLELEKLLIPTLRYEGGKARLSKDTPLDKVYAIFSINRSDAKQTKKFVQWFNARFVPIFLGWMTNLQGIDKSVNLHEVDVKLKAQEKVDILRESHIGGAAQSPYTVMANPFNGEDALVVDKASVERQYEKLYLTMKSKLGKVDAGTALAQSKTNTEQWQKSTERQQLDEKAAAASPSKGPMMQPQGPQTAWQSTKNFFGSVGNSIAAGWNRMIGAQGSNVTQGELAKNVPKTAEENEKVLIAAAIKYGITDPMEQKMFLAQCAHESGWFKHLKELGGPNYWKKYEGRRDLGNVQAGDGVKFPGRGFIQMTGRGHYEAFAKASGLDVVNNPDMISNDPAIAAEASAFWWTKRAHKNIRSHAAKGDVRATTRIVNGGTNGLDDRIAKFKHYLAKYGNKAPMDALKDMETRKQTEGVAQSMGVMMDMKNVANGKTPTPMMKPNAPAGGKIDSASGEGMKGTTPNPLVKPLGTAPQMTMVAAGTAAATAKPTGATPWMTVAEREIGVTEQNNPNRVTEYHRVGAPGMNYTGNNAWCASFVGWCLAAVGLPQTKSAAAPSYKTYGDSVDLKGAIPYGAICVVSVPGQTASGTHVFFCAGEENGRIKAVGGNQGGGKRSGHTGGVTRSSFPRSNLLAARWPKGVASGVPAPTGGSGGAGSTPTTSATKSSPAVSTAPPLQPGERRLVNGAVIPASGNSIAPTMAVPGTTDTPVTQEEEAKARASRAIKARNEGNATDVVTPSANTAQRRAVEDVNLERRRREEQEYATSTQQVQQQMLEEQKKTNETLDHIFKLMLEQVNGSRQQREAAEKAQASNPGSRQGFDEGGQMFGKEPVDFSKRS